MKKLKNGWLYKKNYIKAMVCSSLVLLATIGFSIYGALVQEMSTFMILLIAMLGIMLSSTVNVMFYAKDVKELNGEVDKVYQSLDPNSYYNYLKTLDLNILNDETICRIDFYTIWFKNFEGKKEEAKEIFAKYDTPSFKYINMLPLKSLLKIYLLDNKEDAYKVVEDTLNELNSAKIKQKLKQQLAQEIQSQTIRVDIYLGKNVTPEIINALQQNLSPFENAQNRTLLAHVCKDSDPKLALESKNFVLENSGEFKSFIDEVSKIEIDESLIPVEQDEVKEIESNEVKQETVETNEENKTSEEVKEVTEEVKETTEKEENNEK